MLRRCTVRWTRPHKLKHKNKPLPEKLALALRQSIHSNQNPDNHWGRMAGCLQEENAIYSKWCRPQGVVCMDPHLENILNRVCAYSGITVPGDHPFRVRMLYWDGWRHQPLGSQLRSWVLRLAGPKQGAWHLQRNGQSPVGGLLCTWKNMEKLFHPPVSKWCCQVSPTTAGFTLQCIWSAIMESFLRIIPA